MKPCRIAAAGLATAALAAATAALSTPAAAARSAMDVAASAATVTDFVVVGEPATFTARAFCLPDTLLGTVTTQEISSGKVIETSSGSLAFRGVDDFSYRIDFSDGSYVQSGIDRDLIAFVENPSGAIFNRVSQTFQTIYASDGSVVGKLEVHAQFHMSWRDANRDGVPEDGEFATQVDSFRLLCL